MLYHKKRTLRVLFTDFWARFQLDTFWICRFLSEHFEVILDQAQPDLVVFSDYGIDHLSYRCTKLYYSHEVVDPTKQSIPRDNMLCDYSFSFHGDKGRHHYFSLLVEDTFFEELRCGSFGPELLRLRAAPKTRFCNFVYGNERPKERIRFCNALMEYKRVDCPGKVLNNHPPFDTHTYEYARKYEFLSKYKFTITFENQSKVHYTTEKILHAFVAGSVPVYWGNPEVALLFNPRSFINCHDFATLTEAIEWVKAVDQDDALFRGYQCELPILPGTRLHELSADFLSRRLCEIGEAAKSGQSVARRSLYYWYRWRHYFGVKLRAHREFHLQRFRQRIGRFMKMK